MTPRAAALVAAALVFSAADAHGETARALLFEPPALSSDGKTLALPEDLDGKVRFVAPGAVTGEVVAAAVAAKRLAKGGFVALPYDARFAMGGRMGGGGFGGSGGDPVVDGLEVAVAWPDKGDRAPVSVRLAGDELAKGEVAAPAAGLAVAIVTGAKTYAYLATNHDRAWRWSVIEVPLVELPEPALLAELRAEIGSEPILISAAHGGLLAIAAKSAKHRILATGPVAAAAFDPALELVWVRYADRLEVIDLRAASAKGVPIVTGLAAAVPIEIENRTGLWLESEDRDALAVVRLSWTGAKSALVARNAVEPASAAAKAAVKKARKAKLVGAKWLAGQAKRPARRAHREARVHDDLTLPANVAACDRKSDATCRNAARFGASGWMLVVTAIECNGMCQRRCLLLDPAKKQPMFATPPSPTTWSGPGPGLTSGACSDYRFDESGRWLLFGDQFCEIGGACTARGEQPLGWVIPGEWLSLDVR